VAASVAKVSVALGKEELEWARSRAEREGISVSAVLTGAARAAREAEQRKVRQDAAWRSFLKWATKGAGVPNAVLEAARRELDEA
jgi:hypothetical protein